ncbi:MAG: hypothetical protein KJ077_22755 [Anaerolineae bacterium]|nr:hypothetical protein [Anaerolineae bacterium]
MSGFTVNPDMPTALVNHTRDRSQLRHVFQLQVYQGQRWPLQPNLVQGGLAPLNPKRIVPSYRFDN